MKTKKLFSIMLALSMMLSVVPAKVWATETDDSNIIYKENFDGKTMADFSDWILEDKTASVYSVEAKSADSDDDMLVLKTGTGTANITAIPINNENAMATGKVKVSYKVKPNGYGANGFTRLALKLYNSNNALGNVSLFTFQSWETVREKTNGTQIFKPYANTVWYTCETVIDFESGEAYASIYNADGSAAVENHKYQDVDFSQYSGKPIYGIELQAYGSTTTKVDTYYDDLEISYVVEKAEVTEDSFKIYSGDKVNADKTKVNADADKIVIDFGAEMNSETLKDVTIQNATDNKNLAYEGVVNGTTYEMTLSDLLGYGKNYKITVPATVKTLKDVALGSEFVYDFATVARTIYSENFNGKTISDLPVINSGIGWNFQNEGTYSVVKTDDARQESFCNMTATNETSNVQSWFAGAPTGKIKLKFDVKPNDGTISVNLAGTKLLFTNGTTMYRAYSNGLVDHIGGFTQGEWYSFEYVLDYYNNTIKMTRTDKNGVELIANFTDTAMASIQNINYLWLQAYGAKAMDTYFDNIEISYVAEVPEVSAADVKIYVGENEDTSITAISPKADKITVNLNADMDEATLDNNVLLEAKDGTQIAFDGTLDGQTYVMTLKDTLAEDTEYTLTVGKNVATNRGEILGADFEYTFKTTTKDANTVLYQEDFDGKTIADLKVYNDKDKTGWYYEHGVERHEIANGVFTALTGNDTNAANARVTFGNISTADLGRVKLSFDVLPGGGATTAGLSGGAFWPMVYFSSGGRVHLRNVYEKDATQATHKDYTSYEVGKWYSCSIVYDFDKGVIEVSLCPEEGTISKTVFENIDLARYQNFATVQLQTHGGSSGRNAYWDNVKVELDSLDPVVTSQNVAVYTNDVAEDKASVNPTANKIEIDFNATMDEETLEGMVTLTNVTDGEDVSFIGSVNKTKYVMTITEHLLANKEYKIFVSKDVENIKGVALGDDFTTTFKTNAGKVDATLTGLVQNSSEVLNFAGLAEGVDGTVNIEVKNSTGIKKEAILLYNYYSGKRLVKSVVSDVTIAADAFDTTVSDTVKIESLTGIDCVKVLLWDNFTNIKPMSTNITLD